MADWEEVEGLLRELRSKAGGRVRVRGTVAVASVLDEIRAGNPVVWRRPKNFKGVDYAVGDYVDLSEDYAEGGKLASYIEQYIELGELMTARAYEHEPQAALLKDFLTQDLEPIVKVRKEAEISLSQNKARVQMLTGALRDAKGAVKDGENALVRLTNEVERVAKGGREAARWFFDGEKRERMRSENRKLQEERRFVARLVRQGMSEEDAAIQWNEHQEARQRGKRI